jgi:hypothetical protein
MIAYRGFGCLAKLDGNCLKVAGLQGRVLNMSVGGGFGCDGKNEFLAVNRNCLVLCGQSICGVKNPLSSTCSNRLSLVQKRIKDSFKEFF